MANVAAGSYAITTKTVVDVAGGFGGSDVVVCTLVADGTTLDQAEYRSESNFTALTMVGTATFASTSSILLRCRSTDSANVRFSRIVAVKVDSIQRDAVSG